MDTTKVIRSARLVETLPVGCLPMSSLVDAIQLAAGTRNVFRSRLLDGAAAGPILDWCDGCGLVGTVDEDRYVIVGTSPEVVEEALLIDRSSLPHEIAFGLLLGYPICCCTAVAEKGEAKIDRLAEVAARWKFCGDFSLIDPSGYSVGEALICHVPCSPQCRPSLLLAWKALILLERHPRLLAFSNWQALLRRAKLLPA